MCNKCAPFYHYEKQMLIIRLIGYLRRRYTNINVEKGDITLRYCNEKSYNTKNYNVKIN